MTSNIIPITPTLQVDQVHVIETQNHSSREVNDVVPHSPQIRVNDIREYYDSVASDNKLWSKSLNIHFGYWEKGFNPLKRESQLKNMNKQIISRLKLTGGMRKVVDLGCGFGAVSAYGAQLYPQTNFLGLTISPAQAGFACREKNLTVTLGDYHSIPERDESCDGGFFVESFCHSSNKAELLKESIRVLKPGSRLVIADGFRMKSLEKTGPVYRWLYKAVCRNYFVEDFAFFNEIMEVAKRNHLIVEHAEDASFRIAPTTLHSIFLSAACYLKGLFSLQSVKGKRLNNLIACFLSHFLGLNRSLFRYYIITFRKSEEIRR